MLFEGYRRVPRNQIRVIVFNNMKKEHLDDPVINYLYGSSKENPTYSIAPGQNGTAVFQSHYCE
jgi:hypothetical protein